MLRPGESQEGDGQKKNWCQKIVCASGFNHGACSVMSVGFSFGAFKFLWLRFPMGSTAFANGAIFDLSSTRLAKGISRVTAATNTSNKGEEECSHQVMTSF